MNKRPLETLVFLCCLLSLAVAPARSQHGVNPQAFAAQQQQQEQQYLRGSVATQASGSGLNQVSRLPSTGGSHIDPGIMEQILLQHNFDIEAQMSRQGFQREMMNRDQDRHREDLLFQESAQIRGLQAQRQAQLEQLNRQAEQAQLDQSFQRERDGFWASHGGWVGGSAGLSGSRPTGPGGGGGVNIYFQNNGAPSQQNNLGPNMQFGESSFQRATHGY
jgi:hypothetical protein